MKIVLSVEEITEYGLWGDFCNVSGIDYYARHEGTVKDSDTFEFFVPIGSTINIDLHELIKNYIIDD